MKKLYSKTLFFLIPGLLTLLSVNGQRLVNLDFNKDVRIVAYGTSSAISTTSTAIDGSYVFAGTGYSGGASSGSKITLGGTVIGQRGAGEIFTIPAAGSNNARQINFSNGSSATVNFNNTGGYKFSNIYYLFTTNAGGASSTLSASAYYTYTNGASTQNSLALNYTFYDWNNNQQANVDSRLGSYSTTIRNNNNAGQSRFLFELMDYPSQGTPDNQQPFDAIVNSITFTNQTGTGSLFLMGAVGVPMANISGTVYADNTNDGTPNGVGTNAAASNISCVDAKTNIVLATATIASNGTYTMENVKYPTDATSNNVNMILTIGTAPAVGSILTSSSLNTGWSDGFDPGANRMGTQTNAIRNYARGYVDLTADISVHPLPTADSKIVNFTSSGVTPVQGGQYRMNVPVVGSTTYNSSNGTMLDLSGNVGLNNSTALTTANGTSNSMGFYIPTAISDGGSLIYNGSTVAANTVYPTSSGAFTGYSNSLLYYKFSPTGTAKQYSFTYKAVDQFGFISATAATYTINLAYALPVAYTKELTGNIINKEIVLSWTTGAEINNKAFYVQRSDDATDWSDISTVASYYSNGTGSGHAYNFTDASPLSGSNYYRLNQVDLDGTPHYSKIIQLNYAYNANGNIGIYPNPVVDDLNIINLPTTAKNVVIYSIDGRLISQAAVNGTNLQISVSNLPSAIYFAKIVDKDGKKIQTIKFVKK